MAWSCGTSTNHVTISSQTGSEPEPYEFNPLKQGVSGPEHSNSAVAGGERPGLPARRPMGRIAGGGAQSSPRALTFNGVGTHPERCDLQAKGRS